MFGGFLQSLVRFYFNIFKSKSGVPCWTFIWQQADCLRFTQASDMGGPIKEIPTAPKRRRYFLFPSSLVRARLCWKQKIPPLLRWDFFEVANGFEPPYKVLQTSA